MFLVEGISKYFEGLKAVDGVSLSIDRGEISSIIGPNGAGKTTLFNLLTGHIRLDSGRIIFKGEEITGLSPHKICRKGIGRSFQRTNIFPRLSAFDNIQIAIVAWGRKSGNMFLRAERLFEEATIEILESVGLGGKGEILAGHLAHGDQRRLEIGIALGSHPELLLLDEPTAGMSPEESTRSIELIQKLAREKGLTILFIEHDMSVVFRISERIWVMHMGKIITEGTPQEIRKNQEVQKIYLGDEENCY